MEWRKEYELGIAEFDEEHRALVQAISVLAQSVRKPAPMDDIGRLIVRLANYLRVHFQVEEHRMRATAYPGFGEHVIQHRGCLAKFTSWQSEALAMEKAEEVVAFVKDWVANHITDFDHALARYLLDQDSGPPEARRQTG